MLCQEMAEQLDANDTYTQEHALALRKREALSVLEGKVSQQDAASHTAMLAAEASSSAAADTSEAPLACREPHATDPVAVASQEPAVELDKQLAALGMAVEQLSELGKKQLEAIAGVSERLGVTTTKQAAVLASVVQLRKQQWTAEDAQAGAEGLGKGLKVQIEILRANIQQLKETYASVGEIQAGQLPEIEEKQQRKQRLIFKTDNYVEELSQLEAKLKRDGFVPELRHESLTARSAALAAKQAEIATLQERLNFFRDLPPDMDAACQLYAAKFSQMEAASKQFEEGLAQL